MSNAEVGILLVIGAGLFLFGALLGFALGYMVRSAKSHRRRREAEAMAQTISARGRRASGEGRPRAEEQRPSIDLKGRAQH